MRNPIICIALLLGTVLTGTANADITVFTARKIVTLDPGWPDATCIAVEDGRILSVGRTMDDLAPWLKKGKFTVDETFKEKVLVPGFVEGHGHPLIGAIALTRPCLSRVPQPNPYGPEFPGIRDLEEARKTIAAYLASHPDDGKPVVFWGYDVIPMGRHLDAKWLDAAAGTRPVFVWDASEHFVYANSSAMKLRGVTKEALKVNGVMAGPDGEPNGQFLGATAASWVLGPEMVSMLTPESLPGIMKYLVDLGLQNGITTTSEMALGMVAGVDKEVALFEAFFRSPAAPLRCVVATAADAVLEAKKDGAIAFVKSLEAKSDTKLIYRGVKFFADDAFLSYGMQMVNPGYTDGRTGLWMTKPEDMVEAYWPWWNAGFQLHTHTNGNAGVAAVVDALAGLQAKKPRFDHRFTIQHYGISTPEDARRLSRLQGLASVNPYYLYNRADINAPFIGTDRAETAARLATLLQEGVLTALHTDTPVAPPHPLESIWIAVNRIGRFSGKVLGAGERITPMQALRMVTIDAAYSLGVEKLVGSIQTGKMADFAVLSESPLDVDPMKIRDIKVWGVVIGGNKFPVTGIKPLPAPAGQKTGAKTAGTPNSGSQKPPKAAAESKTPRR